MIELVVEHLPCVHEVFKIKSKVQDLQKGSAVKALAVKPGDLSSIPRNHMEKERI